MGQRGYLFRKGSFWFIRYWEPRMIDGRLQKRLVARKLTEVQPEDLKLRKAPVEVRKLQAEYMGKVNASSTSPVGNRTLSDFAEQVWLPHLEKRLRKGSVKCYAAYWHRNLEPYVGHLWIRNFRTAQAQQMFEAIAKANPEMKKTTLQRLKSTMSSLFTTALFQDYRPKPEGHPIEDVMLPKAPESAETYAYTTEQVNQFLMRVTEPVARTIIAVAAYAGLRRSEISGLTWEAYDGKVLWVWQSVVQGQVGKTKTVSSKAPVPVIRQLRLFLDDWRQRCGNPVTGLMFPTSCGTPRDLNNVLNDFIRPKIDGCRHCGKLKVEHQTADHQYERNEEKVRWHGWHAFRRGLATNLHELGVSDLTIQAILRHSSVEVTRRCYIKTTAKSSDTAMQRFEDTLDSPHAIQ